uniref:Uncharacterized protein n=1 Tax=Glossina brevipalpis TaxID=37001 RepID=A0A1A9WAR3_9MUSC
MNPFIQIAFVLAFFFNICLSVDLCTSYIYTVTNQSRYTSLHHNVTLKPFTKTIHVKGNVIFNIGERIEGDRLIVTHTDEAQYTREEDIEAILKYPQCYEDSKNGYTLTFVQVYVSLTSDDAFVYFVGKSGGIGQRFCQILLTANQTHNYSYQIYFYGY